MMSIMSYCKYDVILVKYPFTDLSSIKIRPAIIISESHPSEDYFIVPLTSRIDNLLAGEFILEDWKSAGLNVKSAVKRGIFTISKGLIIKKIGNLSSKEKEKLRQSLQQWLGV